MRDEGPALEQLTRRLAECPPDFLEEPRPGEGGVVDPLAVVSDLLRDLGGDPLADEAAARVRGTRLKKGRNGARLILIASWLLHDEWFLGRRGDAPAAELFLLSTELDSLAEICEASQFVLNPERREELARRALRALALRPAGETPAQAQDRLTTLDSVETRRVVAEVRQREKRAQQVREAMRLKAMQAAAAKVSRE